MKTILLPTALCIIMLLVFSCVMDSAMADNDVTSSGATDIDQANSTGSNTSISGGYNSEATTNYQSGSSANTTSTTNNTTNAYVPLVYLLVVKLFHLVQAWALPNVILIVND